MKSVNYYAAPPEQCLAFAIRSGKIALAIASKLEDKEPVARLVLDSKIIKDVMEKKRNVPIPGLQMTKSFEAVDQNFNSYNPSLLVKAIYAFEEHVNGVFTSETESRLEQLEDDFSNWNHSK